MSRRHALIAAVALLIAPDLANGQVMPGDPADITKPVTIYVDNRAPCFGGRIGQARENDGRRTANREARRLRKLGYTVRVVTLSAGMDRTAADINTPIFTAMC